MAFSLRALLSGATVFALTAAAAAQTELPGDVRGRSPDSRFASFDSTVPQPIGTALQTPQPAECLCDPAGQDRPWVLIAPYSWIFGVHGTVGAGRVTAPVAVSVSDAIDELDKLKGALQLHVEAGYGDLGFIADVTYLNMAHGGAFTTLDSQSGLFELLGLYRVVDTGRQAGGITFDVLAGARYYHFSNTLESFRSVTLADRSSSWIDAVVGARAGVRVTDDLGLWVRGDIGGFGIGHSSTQACNIITGFEYRCCECMWLAGGYRWFKIDRESGVGRDRFLFDATLAGPFVALNFRF